MLEVAVMNAPPPPPPRTQRATEMTIAAWKASHAPCPPPPPSQFAAKLLASTTVAVPPASLTVPASPPPLPYALVLPMRDAKHAPSHLSAAKKDAPPAFIVTPGTYSLNKNKLWESVHDLKDQFS